MLNYIELQDNLKSLPDDGVKQVATNPASPLHGTLAVGELERRARLRNDAMAKQAQPLTTIAEQLVTGAPNTPVPMPQQQQPGAPQAGPAPPSQMGQAPMGMANGGSVDNLRGIQALMRLPEYETFAGARSAASEEMGADPYAELRAMIQRFRGGADDRNNMDITQLLARIGTGMMNSRRPDFLGAVGEGAQGGVEGLDNLVERRNAEQRMEISDEGTLARLGAEREGQERALAGQLFGAGRGGLEQFADIESGILNSETQRAIANTYAAARGGAGGGSNSALAVTMRNRANRASIAANAARGSLETALRAGADEQDPNIIQARARIAQLELAEREAWAAAMQVSGGEGAGDGLATVDIGADLEMPDPAAGAAPETNAQNIRPQAQQNPGVLRHLQAWMARIAAESEVTQRGGSDAEREAAGAAAEREALGEGQRGPGGYSQGSYDEFARRQHGAMQEDLGDYRARVE